MLTAEKKEWFEKIFSIYNRNLIKRRFNQVRVENLDCVLTRNKQIPLIFCANHSSWWDGLIGYQLWRTCKIDGFVMMEEKQLKKFRLFRKIGAFSVVRESPRQAVESLNYAAKLLKEKENRALWIFPQGGINPNDARPLNFYNGISRIIEKTGNCQVIMAAIRYEFSGDFKPDIFIKLEKMAANEISRTVDSKLVTANLENRLMILLDALKSEIANGETESYRKLF